MKPSIVTFFRENEIDVQKLKICIESYLALNEVDTASSDFYEKYMEQRPLVEFLEVIKIEPDNDSRTIQDGEGACERPAAELH